MNERGCYGRPRRPLLGASPDTSDSKDVGVGTTAAVAVVGIGVAMLAMRSLRKSYRVHQREIHSINRPLAVA